MLLRQKVGLKVVIVAVIVVTGCVTSGIKQIKKRLTLIIMLDRDTGDVLGPIESETSA
jgi:hypothetical protein